MGSLISILLLALFFCPFTTPAQTRAVDVKHYKFEIELSDQSDTIKGRAFITVRFLDPSKSISFDLGTVHNGKGMLVQSCEMNGEQVNLATSPEKINLGWSKEVKKDETRTFIIHYKGIPEDGLIISKNMYGHRSFFADNWPDRGHKWLPCVDDPGDKASVEFIVTAPQHYRVVSNGVLVKETNHAGNRKITHWKEEVPIATKVMVIGVADFAVDLAGTVQDSIPVYSWVYPENKEKGFYDYAQAKEILPFFIHYAGPYGYKKLANVQSKTTFGGLENANTIFYAENSITGTRKSESLLAHEIAHQWFGNMAGEKSFAHLWLSEGFATYMTILYMKNKYGKDTAVYMLQEDRQQVIGSMVTNKRPVVDETTNYMALLNTNSYQKGSWVLHMLHRQLGEQDFHKGIRAYYAKYAGSNAGTRDLQKIFETVSGKDLSVFFDQWLYRPGIPRLNVQWSYSAERKKLVLTVQQIQDKEFIFPLQFRMQTSAGKLAIGTLNIKQRNEVFELDAKAEVTDIELDPETSLLFKAEVYRK